jgi:hypothetical protein
MTIPTQVMKPGYLVSLKTEIEGNVRYERDIIEAEHVTSEGTKREEWNTKKTVFDPEEHDLAVKVRGKARSVITACCAMTKHGLLCLESNLPKLEQAAIEARKFADKFNDSAKLSRITVSIFKGRIAQDDVEAMRAINKEVRDLLRDMEQGVANLDVAKIRESANSARNVGQMLTPDAAERLQTAIDVARVAARKIRKAGEEAAQEVDTATIRRINEQRCAFLDFDAGGEIQAPIVNGTNIDLAPETETPVEMIAPRIRRDSVELD